MQIDFPHLTEIEQVVFAMARDRFSSLVQGTKRLVIAIQELSDYYIADPEHRGACPNTKAHQAARMVFFTIADMPKAFVLAAELDTLMGIAPKSRVNVLDLGVGYGAQSLGLLSYLQQKYPEQQIRLDAFDRDAEALDAFDQLIMNCQNSRIIGNVAANIWKIDLEQGFSPNDQYDFIIIGSTLCELQTGTHYQLLTKLLSALTDSGVLFIIEPALKTTSRNLHQLRNMLLAEHLYEVIAPCTRTQDCPCLLNAKDWCHESRHYELPARCRQLAATTGLRTHEVKWSYLTLTRQHVTNEKYLNAWRVVSDLMKPKGKQEVFLCGEPGRFRAILQKRDRTSANRIFKKLHRGQLVWIQEPEIRNDHLMLGRESTVRIEEPIEQILI